MVCLGTPRPTRLSGLVAAGALTCASVLGSSRDAYAQRVYVYAPAPPPPPRVYVYRTPPPPPAYYAAPPPRYYYRESEPRSAFALGVDLEGAVPVNVPRFLDGATLRGGAGAKLRLGDQIRFRNVRFTPEGGYAYDHLWVGDNAGDTYSWDMHRVFGGVRLSFGHVVVPTIYAHVGYGWRTTSDPTVPEASGIAFDAGGALDLRPVPQFAIGVHVEYATIDAQPYSPQWIALGVHADLAFF